MDNNMTEIAVAGNADELKKNINIYTGSIPAGILQKVKFSGWNQGENVEILEILIEAGADIDGIEGDFNSTPLHTAAMIGSFPDRSFAVTDYLLKKGANPNIKNSKGETPIFQAINTVSDKTVKRLIEGGADVNIKNNDGVPLLHKCLIANIGFLAADLDEVFDKKSKKYKLKHLDYLLESNPDFTLKNSKGYTIIQESLLHKIFLEKNLTSTILKSLIDKGCPTDVKFTFTEENLELSLLAYAIVTNPKHSFDAINILTDVNNILENELGTPNIFELMYYNPNVGIEILKSRPTLIKSEYLGSTLLHSAIESESISIEIIEFLIENGIDPNKINSSGNTVLSLAIELNVDKHIIELLNKHQK